MQADPRQQLHIDNLNVSYFEFGNRMAKTVLLIHGGFGDALLNWGEFAPSLAEYDYHVVALDLPGFGDSDALPQMSYEALIAWLKSVMDALGLQQAAMIGASFGAQLVRLFAAVHPTYVPALVLVNGGAITTPSGVARLLAGLPIFGVFMMNRLSRSYLMPSAMSTLVHDQAVLTEDVKANLVKNAPGLAGILRLSNTSTPPENKTPRVPVLILWGQQDQVTGVNVGKSMERNIPGAKFSEIADCGHLPHIETSDVFLWQVRSFFDSLSR